MSQSKTAKEIRQLRADIAELEQEIERLETCHWEEPNEECYLDMINDCEMELEEKWNRINWLSWLVDTCEVGRV